MKKPYYIAALTLCAALLAGCASTPESAVVREKGAKSLEHYAEETDVSGAETDTNVSGEENGLAARLQVPETYEASKKSSSGNFELTCSASLEIPSVDQVSVYKVGQKSFDQAWISTVTKAFFGDLPVYEGGAYFQNTKEQALAKLNQLKAWQAEGNTDPYGYIADAQRLDDMDDVSPEEIYSLQQEIDSWQEIYETAPETTIKNPVTPGFPDENSGDADAMGNLFIGAVEMDGGVFQYKLKKTEGSSMEIEIIRKNSDDYTNTISWYEMGTSDDSPEGAPTVQEAEKMAGITKEEALETADSYIEKLGLTDFSAKRTELSLCSVLPDMGFTPSYPSAGYLVTYTRDIQGFPVTDEMNYGGGLESMESTLVPWGYEKVELYVNGDGLQQATIYNLYEVQEQQTKNVALMSFPEIAGIFERMIEIQNTGTEGLAHMKLDISRVTLGYMRVYDPGADNTTGLLVPVWDFFGSSESEWVYEGESHTSSNSTPSLSYLTINAVDGTIINRSLGY